MPDLIVPQQGSESLSTGPTSCAPNRARDVHLAWNQLSFRDHWCRRHVLCDGLSRFLMQCECLHNETCLRQSCTGAQGSTSVLRTM